MYYTGIARSATSIINFTGKEILTAFPALRLFFVFPSFSMFYYYCKSSAVGIIVLVRPIYANGGKRSINKKF